MDAWMRGYVEVTSDSTVQIDTLLFQQVVHTWRFARRAAACCGFLSRFCSNSCRMAAARVNHTVRSIDHDFESLSKCLYRRRTACLCADMAKGTHAPAFLSQRKMEGERKGKSSAQDKKKKKERKKGSR